MGLRSIFRGPAALCLVACATGVAAESPRDRISFNRDVRPIMSDTCFHCHGFDAQKREAGLRLDVREAALAETEGGVVPIVPGDPDASAIIRRILDTDDPMPPESAHKPLSAEQKAILSRWVAEGAEYEPHWAYAPLSRPPLPPDGGGTHPSDAFLNASLAAKGLAPGPEAAPETLARRVALDLTGLPPQAALPGGAPLPADHGAAVDALLASPHFGERMAVWWLDIARFADTVGFHGDQNQRIFPYRDWVIAAFNANQPFDAFTREQLAGDLLPQPTTDQLVATGYNRLTMMTREGGAQPREFLAKYGAERVRAVSAAWLGTTFGCAECHDHKFDPISSRDFYELQAFFADVKQWGVYMSYDYTPEPELQGFTNDHPFPPEMEVESPWLVKELGRTRRRLAKKLAEAAGRAAADPAVGAALARWDAGITAFLATHAAGWAAAPPGPAPEPAAVPAAQVTSGSAARSGPSADGSQPAAAPARRPTNVALRAVFTPRDVPSVAAVRLSLATERVAPGDLPGRLGTRVAIKVELHPGVGEPRGIGIKAGQATVQRPSYSSGVEVTGLGAEWRLPEALPADRDLTAVWLLDPVSLADGDALVVTVTGDPGLPLDLAVSPLAATQPLDAVPAADLEALRTPSAARSSVQASRVAAAFLLATAHDRAAFDTVRRLAGRERELCGGKTWTMVTRATPEPLPVRVLPRGNWQDEGGPVVLPATPSFLPGRIESTPDRRLTRLDLADWLTSDANPITARAVVNRLWAAFFGTGLSMPLDDLGSQGEPPSHPELLDWLACEFRESGWDVKRMVRLIVTSAAYRRSSSLDPRALAVDPVNRLLATQSPRRLEAEFVRDNALAIADLLHLEDIGGPSVKPYQPDGHYDSLQFPNRTYRADADARQWRRGVYVHWQRTFLHPMLAAFDAPARDESCACRIASNTPQQALTLLNDPEFVEAARAFAARLLEDGSTADDASRIRLAYRLALNREPRDRELASLTAFLATQRDAFAAAPADAERSLAVGLAPRADLDPVEHAAWAQLARVILNLNETITRY
ncbi:MAG: PSD1 and planctomycete cytochrome C domain-containing protein [Planctomycetaceae bacterium]